MGRQNEVARNTFTTLAPAADFLSSAADETRNPQTAAFRSQVFETAEQSISGWQQAVNATIGLSNYTASAAREGRWDDVNRAAIGWAQMGMAATRETRAATIKGIAATALGIVSTPYRLVTESIPNFGQAVRERGETHDRVWDVLLTGALLEGDIAGTYALGRGALSLANRTRAATTIETPYGPARQDLSIEALRLRWQVARGRSVYRGGSLDKSGAAEGQFWAPESPLSPGYAERYGVASFTDPDFIIRGQVKTSSPFVTRRAPSVGSNPGGALEIVTRVGDVVLDFFHMP